MQFILKVVVGAVGIVIADSLIAGVAVDGLLAALLAAVVLGVLNALVRPVLLFFAFPINVVTLGLFTLVVNGLVFWAAAAFVAGVTISGFWAAFWAALVISLLTTVVDRLSN